ncbi:hypothetical protein [Muricoccus vinaceus]|uniref:Uncharacterized protein n=1 Tax=Muricoccus vinaceus TaxID=424704 RepID=A0ABV6IL33_9PROT
MQIQSFGTWSGNPTSFTQQWQRSGAAGGPWTNVDGATSTSYTPPAADSGKWFRAAITGVNAAGPSLVPLYSNAAQFTASQPSVPVIPEITYTPIVEIVDSKSAATTQLGLFSPVPAGVTRTFVGNVTMSTDKTYVLRGINSLQFEATASLDVTDSPIAGGVYDGAKAVTYPLDIPIAEIVVPPDQGVTPIPAITYTSKLSTIPADAVADLDIGTLSVVPAGVIRTVTGTLALGSDQRGVVPGTSAKFANTPVVLNVKDSPDPASSQYTGATEVTLSVAVNVAAAEYPLAARSGIKLLMGLSKLRRDFSGSPITTSSDGNRVAGWADQDASAVANIGQTLDQYRPLYAAADARFKNRRPLYFDGSTRRHIASPSGILTIDSGNLLLGAGMVLIDQQPATHHGALVNVLFDGQDFYYDNAYGGWAIAFNRNTGLCCLYFKKADGQNALAGGVAVPKDLAGVISLKVENSKAQLRWTRNNTAITGAVFDWPAEFLNRAGTVYWGQAVRKSTPGVNTENVFNGLLGECFISIVPGDEFGVVDDIAALSGIASNLVSGGTSPSTGGATGGSTNPSNPSTPSVVWTGVDPGVPYAHSNFDLAAMRAEVPTTSVAGVIFTPTTRVAASANEVVGFNYTTDDRALAAQYGSHALAFEPGKLLATDAIEQEIGGTAVRMQVEPLQVYPDNTVKHAQVFVMKPVLAAGEVKQALVKKGSAVAMPSGSNVDITAAKLNAFTAIVTVRGAHKWSRLNTRQNPRQDGVYTTVGYGTPVDVSPSQLHTQEAAASITPEYRSRGPIATQRTYRMNLQDMLRVEADVTLFVDGTQEVDLALCCDRHGPGVNPNDYKSWNVLFTLNQGGTNVFTFDGRLAIGQRIHKLVRSALSPAQNTEVFIPIHVEQIDMPYNKRLGMIHAVGLDKGTNVRAITDASYAASSANLLAKSDAGKPLSANGINFYLGQGAGQDYIDIIPGHQARFLVSGHPTARKVVFAQADTSGHMIINHFNDVTKRPVNLFDTPNLWIDGRGKVPDGFTFPDEATWWEPDGAHQPMLPALAFYLTGRPYYQRLLEHHSAFWAGAFWSSPRTKTVNGVTKDWCLTQNLGGREAGWNIRDQVLPFLMLPDNSFFKSRIKELLAFNFLYLNSKISVWKAAQGEPFGWLPAPYVAGDVALKPWMLAHYHTAVMLCAVANIPGARFYIENFAHNWNVGRYQQGTVVPMEKADWYNFFVRRITNIETYPPDTTTWAGMNEKAQANQLGAGGFDWDGAYARQGMRAFAAEMNIFNRPADRATLAQYIAKGPPYASTEDYRNTPQEYVRPMPWVA